ncbi:MAG: DMT family transporter [Fibrobacteres bacterium]|nr:DMT family transporter [Fibrobacterota bacterium]
MASRPDLNKNIRKGLAVAVTASALFSAKSVFHKLCFRYGTPPVVLQTLRALFSLPFFVWPFVARRFAANFIARRAAARSPAAPFEGKRPVAAPTFAAKDVLILAVLGLTGFYVASLLDMLGLQYVSAGTERLILYVYPTLVILFSAFIFRKAIPRALYAPLALSYLGIAVSFGGEAKMGGSRSFYGGCLVFGSAICYALFMVFQGKLVHRYGPRFFAAGCMLFSFAGYFVHFLICYPLSALAQPRPVLWIAAFTAVFCNVAPTYLTSYAIKLAGSGPTSVAGTVGPVSTLVLSSWLLGEKAGWPQIVGLALVVAGALRLSAGGKGGGQGPSSPPAPAKGASGSATGGGKFASSTARGTPASAPGRRASAMGISDSARAVPVPPELSDPAASAAAFLASTKGGGSMVWGRGNSHSRSA